MQVELDGIIYAKSERYVLHCRRARAAGSRRHTITQHNSLLIKSASFLPPILACSEI